MAKFHRLPDAFRKIIAQTKTVFLFLAAILLLLSGIIGARLSGTHIDQHMRKELALQATLLASAIPSEEIAALSFTEEDLNRPEFIRIRKQLQNFSDHVEADFIGSLALKNDQIVFGPESLPATDPRATPPGTVFLNATEEDFDALQSAEPSIQGPIEDEYGIFVRAAAPVIHPRTGKALMHVVLCQSSELWKQKVRTAQWPSLMISSILLLILFAGWILMATRHRLSAHLHHRLRHTEAITCALVFLSISIAVTSVVYHEERSNRDETFRFLASQKVSIIRYTFQTIENNLILLKNLFESSEQITDREFAEFCRPILEKTMIEKVEWMPRIPEEQRDLFEQQIQEKTEWKDFCIREQVQKGDLTQAISRPVYFPVLFTEPPENAQLFRGLDMYSFPIQKTAMEETLQTDRTSASTVFLEGTNQLVSLFSTVSTSNHPGMVSFTVNPTHLLKTLAQCSDNGKGHTCISLLELCKGQPPVLLACTNPENTDSSTAQNKTDRLTAPLFAFGKSYMLYMRPTRSWLEANPMYNTVSVAIGSLLLTGLFTSLIGILANRPALLEEKVRQRTAELRRAEEYARAVLDSATDAIFIHHPETGAILDFNKTAEQMFGISRNEIGTITASDLVAEEPHSWQTKGLPVIQRTAQGQPQLIEWTARQKNGNIFPVEISLTGARIGGETRVIAGVRNITERKKAAEELKTSEARFRIAAEAANIGVWERDLVSHQLFWDERMFALYGYDSPTEDASKLWKKAIHPEDAEDVLSESKHTEQKGEFNRRFRIILPNGKTRYIYGIGKMLRNEKGVPSRIIGINYDVTEQREAEIALKKSESRFRSLFEMAAVGICEISTDGQWIGVNRKLCDITGYAEHEIQNISFREITHPDDRGKSLKLIRELLDKEQTTHTLKERYIRKDGSIIWVELTVSLVRNPNGSPDRFIFIVVDITDRIHAEESLQQRMEELHRFNRAATGRELRMIELKREINALCCALGREVPYPLHSL